MTSNVNEILNSIGAFEFQTWNNALVQPYSEQELRKFENFDEDQASNAKLEFENFRLQYESLSEQDKQLLMDWVYKRYVEPAYKASKALQRPEFAKRKFFPLISENARLLDVAPAHGCHGALVYRDLYKQKFDLHTCDLVPAYNKLLTMAKIRVNHVDLRFLRLKEEYKENAFDAVMLTEVLEHISQKTEDNLCEDLQCITSHNAHVFITFPEHALPRSANVDPEPFGHIRQPNIEAVSSKLRGFKVVESGKFFSGKVNQYYMICQKK